MPNIFTPARKIYYFKSLADNILIEEKDVSKVRLRIITKNIIKLIEVLFSLWHKFFCQVAGQNDFQGSINVISQIIFREHFWHVCKNVLLFLFSAQVMVASL